MVREVIAAAVDLFVERGPDRVSLRDVASRARVHPALIHRYIGVRSALVDAVYRDLALKVTADIRRDPLGQRSFRVRSTVGRWTRILVGLALAGEEIPTAAGDDPVDALRDVAADVLGLDDHSARVRAAQVMASAVGWRLLEPYLVKAAGLGHMSRAELRDELNAMHRLVGSTRVAPRATLD